MSPSYIAKAGCANRPESRRTAQAGFSLLEVLLCLTMLALIMLPFTLTLGSTAQTTRAAYLQSTRTLLLNSMRNETTPTDPNYVSNFTDSAMNTSVSDSGQTIPYRRVVDATTVGASNGMKRTTLFYLYNNATDASGSPRYKTALISYPKVFRMRFGDTPGLIDTLGRYWYSDQADSLVYNSTTKVPGWTTAAGHFTSNFWGNDILNVSGNDDQLYQTETGANSLTYSMDVDNAAYTVKLYFCETNGGINATTSTRRMDITIEGVQVNTDGPYSPYESTGATNEAQILMYDTNVSDGVLNITISHNATSNDANVNPHAIEVIKRTMK